MSEPAIVVREQVSVLHALVSSSPDHFYLYDRAGRHLYAIKAVTYYSSNWRIVGKASCARQIPCRGWAATNLLFYSLRPRSAVPMIRHSG